MEGFKVVEKTPNIVWVSKGKIEDRIDCNPYKVEYIENEQVLKQKLPYKTIEQLLRSRKDLTGGSTPLGANYLSDGVRFIRTQNVERNYIDLKDVVYISEEDNKKLTRSILEENDILVTITGADFGRISPVTKECLPANINQHSVRIHFKEDIDPYYVSVFLNSLYGQSQIFRYSIGATRAAIDYTAIKNINIPIPSLEIQKYIGDKVRKAEKLREEAKRLKKEAENLLKKGLSFEINKANEKYWYTNTKFLTEKRLDQSFYKPEYLNIFRKINEYNGQKTKLGDFNVEFRTGAAVSSDDFVSQGIPLIRIRDIDFDKLNFITHNYVSNEVFEKFEGSKSELGDIIVGMDGDDFRANIFVEGNPKSLINQRITIIKSKDINPYYVYFYINSYIGQKQLQRYSVKTTVGHISTKNIKNLIICIPEEKIYKEISEKVHGKLLNLYKSEVLIKEAKQDIEDLIEGNFDISKIKEIKEN